MSSRLWARNTKASRKRRPRPRPRQRSRSPRGPFFVPLRGHFEEFRKIKDFIIPPPPPGWELEQKFSRWKIKKCFGFWKLKMVTESSLKLKTLRNGIDHRRVQRKFDHFCLWPSVKDQGTTRVVVIVVVLFHLSHFLIKKNLSEKNSAKPGF